MNCGVAQIILAFIKTVTICNRFQFPSSFQLRPPFGKLSAARSVAFRVLLDLAKLAQQHFVRGVLPDMRSQPYRISPGISEPRNDLGFQNHSREARASAATVARTN
jgi:hypothetical protein